VTGQIARAATLFSVDEIIVYNDYAIERHREQRPEREQPAADKDPGVRRVSAVLAARSLPAAQVPGACGPVECDRGSAPFQKNR